MSVDLVAPLNQTPASFQSWGCFPSVSFLEHLCHPAGSVINELTKSWQVFALHLYENYVYLFQTILWQLSKYSCFWVSASLKCPFSTLRLRQQTLAFPHLAPCSDVTSCFFIPQSTPDQKVHRSDWRSGVTVQTPPVEEPYGASLNPHHDSEWGVSPPEQPVTLFFLLFLL